MRGTDADRLRRAVARTLEGSLDPSGALPLLHRLARVAEDGSSDYLFAHRKLAELLAERSPWRASLHARRVVAHVPGDDRAWATLALCQTLLGHYHFAHAAYRRALAAAPDNPWYAHNLGHLLDVALGRPADALPHLELAYVRAGDHCDVAASYAHALGCLGRLDQARAVLTSTPSAQRPREHAELLRWPLGRRRALLASGEVPAGSAEDAVRRELSEEFRKALLSGLAHLPLDKKQRVRARGLARDVLAQTDPELLRVGTKSLAAAVAYAVVRADSVPLSFAEVAAPFRISVGELRGAFATLKAGLDLSRVATVR